MYGPGACRSQLFGGVIGPVRIAQQCAREKHRIGLAAGSNLLRLPGLGDQSDRPVAMPASFRIAEEKGARDPYSNGILADGAKPPLELDQIDAQRPRPWKEELLSLQLH
jgi:hypothetical protein